MTIERASGPEQFDVQGPPAGGLEETKYWIHEQLRRLVSVQQQPFVQAAQFAQLVAGTDEHLSRPAEGMLIFAAADVIAAGKPAGLYLYLGGVWMQLQMV